jgi:hypothetical protein
MMNLQSMFLSPTQQYAMQNEQANQQFQRKWMQAQIDASPDPVLAGINAEVMSLAAAYLGGSAKQSDYTQNYSGVSGGGGLGGYEGGWGSSSSGLPGGTTQPSGGNMGTGE